MKTLRLFTMALVTLSMACRLPAASQPSPQTPVTSPENPQPTPTTLWEPTATIIPTPPNPAADLPDLAHPLLAAEEAVFLGDWATALSEYAKVITTSTDPEILSGAQVGQGRVYLLSGDTYNAGRTLQSLLQTQPDSEHAPEAHYLMAQVHQNQNRPADAAQDYQGYLDKRPGVIDTYIQESRGDALQAAGDSAGALTAYQAALNSPRLGPNLDLEIKIAQAYAQTGDSATALVMYADIYQRSEAEYQKAKVDLLQGRLFASQGQPEQAYAAWLDAVNNFPTAYDAYQSLVELVNAGYPVDELQRGIVDYHAREYGVALAALDRYLAGDPADPAAGYYYRGLTLRAIEDYETAIIVWDYMIQTYPESSLIDQAYEQKAYTQWAFLGLYSEASQALLDFTSSRPAHPRAAEFLFHAARIAERAGDLPLASQIWQRVLSEYPGSNLAYESAFQAGIADMRSDSYLSAQTQFLRAQQLSTTPEERSRALFWSAKCYQALGITTRLFLRSARQSTLIQPAITASALGIWSKAGSLSNLR
jgi:soluble lytic murein transglycosylase